MKFMLVVMVLLTSACEKGGGEAREGRGGEGRVKAGQKAIYKGQRFIYRNYMVKQTLSTGKTRIMMLGKGCLQTRVAKTTSSSKSRTTQCKWKCRHAKATRILEWRHSRTELLYTYTRAKVRTSEGNQYE